MEYAALLGQLERLLAQTYLLWEPGWVTFNWRGYTFDHVQRVRGLAVRLCREEQGDAVVTELAGLLHDITKAYDGEYVTGADGKRLVDEEGRWRNETRPPARRNRVTDLYDALALGGTLHNESGAILARHLLQEHGVDPVICRRVADTIGDHLMPPKDAAVESACLYDADTIDANIGLPAFVRNIYINLHFYDQRKKPDAPSIAALLQDAPMEFLRPYVTENLPRWGAGKRKDFVPRLLTEAGRQVATARLDGMDRFFAHLADELDAASLDGHRTCLSVLMYFMQRTDDPSIADEAAHLAAAWMDERTTAAAQTFIKQLQREMAGLE